ncbi:nickel pincer cofactor biosynthesis protein LarC [bacterium]|nr:MAG: nickel pincer cofactor biosynthesis protein LarC [bacterium]
MKIAYVDCFSGISGDMFLAALIDAGLPLETLRAELAKLALPEAFTLEVSETRKGSLRACLLHVDVPHLHEHAHDHEQDHDHEHEHEHAHAHQRGWREIRELIQASPLDESVKLTSLAIFSRLAAAEGRVHGVPAEEVHFHEVGAVDSIVDIVGAAIGLRLLGIERLYASALPMGSGTVESQHGLLPLPAPATLELLAEAKAPTVPSSARVELVTPTGAAILAALATFEQPPMTVSGRGVGAGQRELPWPNLLRLIIGESIGDGGGHVALETNIDDMNPQLFAPVMERLFAAGALDVYLAPIYMKKNRPGTLLGVIARAQDEPVLARLLLEETTTLGVRVHPVARYEAGRESRTVETEFGSLQVKLKLLDGRVLQAAPEYEDCLRVAQAQGVPLARVLSAAAAAGQALITR